MAPRAPSELSPEARAWWHEIRKAYAIEDTGGLKILTEGARAYDRALQAAAILERDGLDTLDRYGQVREHPMLRVERQSREQVLRAIKLLNLGTAQAATGKDERLWR